MSVDGGGGGGDGGDGGVVRRLRFDWSRIAALLGRWSPRNPLWK